MPTRGDRYSRPTHRLRAAPAPDTAIRASAISPGPDNPIRAQRVCHGEPLAQEFRVPRDLDPGCADGEVGGELASALRGTDSEEVHIGKPPAST